MKQLLFLFIVYISFAAIPEGADLLIICPEEHAEAYQPLLEWKIQKGIYTQIITVDYPTGPELRTRIRNVIEDRDYDPKYIIIGGDVDFFPMMYGGSTMYGGFRSDWAFANLSGDLLMDIYIGRLPAETFEDAEVMVAKILEYEKGLNWGSWLGKGVLIVNQDDDSDDALYYANVDTARAAMERSGYSVITELNDGPGGHDSGDIEDAIASGAGFVLYRGQATGNWYMPFAIDPLRLYNYSMPGIIASITCNTITDFGSNYVDYYWMAAGTVDSTQGAVAFYGSTSSISGGAAERCAVSDGFVQAFFSDTTNDLGVVAEAGRLAVWARYADTAQYTSHVLLGDPEMDIRSRPPSTLELVHTGILILGVENEYTFSVTDVGSGLPVANALICLQDGGELYERGFTDSEGNLFITIIPPEMGVANIVVTAHNYLPNYHLVDIISEGPNLYVESYRVDDDGGNGMVNPGETVDVYLTIANNGLANSYGVNVSISIASPFVDFDSLVFSFDSLCSGQSKEITTSFSITLSEENIHIDSIAVLTVIEDEADNIWFRNDPILPVSIAEIELISCFLGDPDGDSRLDPGEAAKIILRLINRGNIELRDISIEAQSLCAGVYFEDAFSFIDLLPIEEEIRNLYDPIHVCHLPKSPISPRGTIRFILTGNADFYTYTDTLFYQMDIDRCQATGPDDYGYFCYDDTDDETGQAPSFDWTAISIIGDICSEVTNSDDGMGHIDLPFDFRYYGEDFDGISICSNGFITVGYESWTGGSDTGHEQVIPHVGEARGIIAGFWKDFNPRDSGEIYTYYNEAEHNYIVEYNRVSHFGYPEVQETFQIILCDPEYYPTITGDGEILMHYHELTYVASNSVGIENVDEDDGLQYLYHSSYDRNAQPLLYGRTLKFTTNPPVMESPWVIITQYEIDDSIGGNGNGIAEGGEQVQLKFSLENIGNVDAHNLVIIPAITSSYASVISSEMSLVDFAVGAEADTLSILIELEHSDLNRTFDIDFAINADEVSRNTALTLFLHGSLNISETQDLPQESGIIAYPNPFNSNVLIRTTENARVIISDLSGREVHSGFGTFNWQPNENLSSGIYIVKTVSDSKSDSAKIFYVR